MTEAVLESLLSPTITSRRSTRPRILIGQGALRNCDLRTNPYAVVVAERDLAKNLRAATGQFCVLAVETMTPNLLRALGDSSIEFVVCTGTLDESQLAAINRLAPKIRLLGPHAVLKVGDIKNRAWVLAQTEKQLLDFERAGVEAQLWMAPCPQWLPAWLENCSNERPNLVGLVSATVLDRRWIELATSSANNDVLVPLGVPDAQITDPKNPNLESLVIAHHLEARTGAVFPDPQVIELVYRFGGCPPNYGQNGELKLDDKSLNQLQSKEFPVWQQARRSLPQIGSQLGMEMPWSSLTSTSAHLAFLAQRTLIRIREIDQMLGRAYSPPNADEDEAIERSLDVLRRSPEVLSEHESKVVLRGFGLEITRQAVANSASRAAEFAMKIGFPVALKALSPDLRRKSDAGAIFLDVGNSAAVRRSYADILHNIAQTQPTVQVDGVVVAEMVKAGLDIHCGGLRMKNGQFALFARPIGIELPLDAVWGPASSHPDDARRMAFSVLSRLPIPGLRRASDPTTHALADVFIRMASLVNHAGSRLLRFDLHPLRIIDDPRCHVVLDATIVQRPHLEGE